MSDLKISPLKILKLEETIKYKFNNHQLLIEAFTHPSLKRCFTDKEKDYERLELLGDSILGFVITEALFKKFNNADEGKLAKLRACLVCKETLCEVAAEINLADYILMTHGEEVLGGRFNQNNLENVLEALLAAIYLDSNIDVVRSIILNLWSTKISDPNIKYSDPKTTLQEWSQKKFNIKPIYQVIEKSGEAHLPTFNVQVMVNEHNSIGQGNSVKSAEKDAARNLISLLNIHVAKF